MKKPFIGTFIGWILSFLCGRTKVVYYEDFTVWLVKRLIPSWAAGQTWGKIILIKSDSISPTMKKHESVHVEQWKRLGFFGLGFMVMYLIELIRNGYWDNKYEIEARENAK